MVKKTASTIPSASPRINRRKLPKSATRIIDAAAVRSASALINCPAARNSGLFVEGRGRLSKRQRRRRVKISPRAASALCLLIPKQRPNSGRGRTSQMCNTGLVPLGRSRAQKWPTSGLIRSGRVSGAMWPALGTLCRSTRTVF